MMRSPMAALSRWDEWLPGDLFRVAENEIVAADGVVVSGGGASDQLHHRRAAAGGEEARRPHPQRQPPSPRQRLHDLRRQGRHRIDPGADDCRRAKHPESQDPER